MLFCEESDELLVDLHHLQTQANIPLKLIQVLGIGNVTVGQAGHVWLRIGWGLHSLQKIKIEQIILYLFHCQNFIFRDGMVQSIQKLAKGKVQQFSFANCQKREVINVLVFCFSSKTRKKRKHFKNIKYVYEQEFI